MVSARLSINIHLKQLELLIKQAEKYQKMVNRKRFLTDEMARDAICRVLQQTIEAILTIGEMVITQNNFTKPETNEDIFEILATSKVISNKLSSELRGVGGFRNVLVHNYISLDLNLAYDYLEKGVPVFKNYAKNIAKYLK
jgi:uncharacterized protein YutE (UPF0331/DUF86 family)